MRHLKHDPELETRMRAALRHLFDNGAQIVSSERLPGEGNSQAVLRVLEIELWIIQSGGSVSVLVSPSSASKSWKTVESVLQAIEPEHSLPPDPVYGSLTDLGHLLESRLQHLNVALSPECFDSTAQAARQATMNGMIALKLRTAAVRPDSRKITPVIIRCIVKVIQLLFPKPKNNRTKFLPVGSDLELERQVRDEFDIVFSKYGAQISSNERLRMMDFASVTFDAGNLRIRASRDRGSVEISIAPLYAVRFWNRLGIALLALQENEENVPSIPSSMLDGSGVLLERNFLKLNDTFSDANYPAMQRRMFEIEKALKQNWIDDFNRKGNLCRASTS